MNPAQRAIKEDKIVGLALDSVLIRRDGFESGIEDSAAPIHNRTAGLPARCWSSTTSVNRGPWR